MQLAVILYLNNYLISFSDDKNKFLYKFLFVMKYHMKSITSSG